jgi:hypothetical protein
MKKERKKVRTNRILNRYENKQIEEKTDRRKNR